METGQLLTRVNMKRDYDQSLYDQALNSIYSSLKFEARKFDAGVSMPIYKNGFTIVAKHRGPMASLPCALLENMRPTNNRLSARESGVVSARRIPWGQGCAVAETFLHAMDFRLMPFQLGP